MQFYAIIATYPKSLCLGISDSSLKTRYTQRKNFRSVDRRAFFVKMACGKTSGQPDRTNRPKMTPTIGNKRVISISTATAVTICMTFVLQSVTSRRFRQILGLPERKATNARMVRLVGLFLIRAFVAKIKYPAPTLKQAYWTLSRCVWICCWLMLVLNCPFETVAGAMVVSIWVRRSADRTGRERPSR